MQTINIGDVSIVYSVEQRPRRKYVAIEIVAHNQINVLIPPSFDHREVESWLRREAGWVLKQLRTQSPTGILPAKHFANGEQFWFQGHLFPLAIAYQPVSTARVELGNAQLHVVLPSDFRLNPSTEPIRRALITWYAEQAQEQLPERIKAFGPIVGAWPTRLKISDYKSRWGSCSHDGTIAFNWRIIQAPLFAMDYVVVHELTHRIHHGHGPAFHAAIQAILPNVAERRQWFKQHAPDLGW